MRVINFRIIIIIIIIIDRSHIFTRLTLLPNFKNPTLYNAFQSLHFPLQNCSFALGVSGPHLIRGSWFLGLTRVHIPIATIGPTVLQGYARDRQTD